tara:strand:- start:7293 stop:8066 length:774 start_codon:yes stop_codon:yes gene_type:complete
MSGDKYVGDCPHMCAIIARAGMTGIESSAGMMGRYFEDSALMVDLLSEHGLQLASLGFGGSFRNSRLSDKERAQADGVFNYLESFPNPRLTLAHGSRDRSDLAERQRNAMACVNEAATLAAERGIACAFHPTSGGYSIFRTADDYKLMLDSLDTSVVGYCPDSGHIVNGDMDVYEIFSTYASVIGHVHLKDISEDKKWAPMGEGIIDFPRLLKTLDDAGYDGWIDIEEESAGARDDPDAATLKNGRYLAETLLPLGF